MESPFLLKVLFAKRRARLKWLAAVPGLLALYLFGFALESRGFTVVAPYAVIVLLTAVYMIRPMLVLWVPVFATFVFYMGVVLIDLFVHPMNALLSEWITFLLLGVVPAILLWLARPGDFAVVASNTDRILD